MRKYLLILIAVITIPVSYALVGHSADQIFPGSFGNNYVGNFNFLNGSVGIGTASPIVKLDVRGNVRFDNSPSTSAGLSINTSGPSPVGAKMIFGDGTGWKMYMSSASSPNSPIMTLVDTGNVGIGTTSPGAKLEVKGARNTLAGGILVSESTGNTGTCYIYVSTTGEACSAGGAALVTGATHVLCASCN